MDRTDLQPRESSNRSLDRRRFLESAAVIGAVLGLDGSAWAKAAGGADMVNSRLPDGTEFPRWEQPLTFSKTYYVNNSSPSADDHGPGDQARPFRTINKAAQVLQPGERVVIAVDMGPYLRRRVAAPGPAR
jgi:hypothetical protein